MSDKSFRAVKEALNDTERYYGKKDVIVSVNDKVFPYNNVLVSINYNIGYMQMDVQVIWEDDKEQISYKELNLHGIYNTNFQDFTFQNHSLIWKDGNNNISIVF